MATKQCHHCQNPSFQIYEIDCQKLLKFLKDKGPLTLLDQLWTNPAVQFHCEAINLIAVGLDIWDETNATNKNAHLLCSRALQSFAANPSTPDNNKRLKKLGALMSSTGRSEIMASIFVMALNSFITEHRDNKGEDTHLQIPGNQSGVAKTNQNGGIMKERRRCSTLNARQTKRAIS